MNQVGKRFFNEVRLPRRPGPSAYPGDGGAPGRGLAHTPLDWRNCRKDWVREMYNYDHGLDAALAMNEGSEAPDYYSGPLWAVFDQNAVERNGWDLRYPYVSDNGYFFQADTIEDLAEQIYAGHEFQRVPLSYLAETVATWNRYADEGADPEFEREVDAPLSRIERPPFYALSIMVVWHDGSTAGSRSWTCRARSSQVSTREARPWGDSTSMGWARGTSMGTSPARMLSRSRPANRRGAWPRGARRPATTG